MYYSSATPSSPIFFKKLSADRTSLYFRSDLMFVKNPRIKTERLVPIADHTRIQNSKSKHLRDLNDSYFSFSIK